MVLVMCSVYDLKTECFGRPFFVKTVGEAVRIMTDEVNGKSEESLLVRHPEDYQLFELGAFEDGSGQCKSLDVPRRVADLQSLKS